VTYNSFVACCNIFYPLLFILTSTLSNLLIDNSPYLGDLSSIVLNEFVLLTVDLKFVDLAFDGDLLEDL